MIDTSIETSRVESSNETAGAALWIGLVTIGSVLGSLAFACAAPLAAMAAVAGLKMRTAEGLALVGAAWLANQLIGFLVLDYPRTWDSFGWGAAIGIATVLAFATAASVARTRMPEIVAIVTGFFAAFVAYEAALYIATALLPSSDAAFSSEVIRRILWVNAVALVVLLLAHRGAVLVRLLKPMPPLETPTTA